MAVRQCAVCGSPYVQSHHIVHGNKGKARWDADWNRMDLCDYHHNDHRQGVHHNEAFKLRTYREMQERLTARLPEWIEDKPSWIKDKDWWQIIKLAKITDRGYSRETIIRRIMGKSYIEEG